MIQLRTIADQTLSAHLANGCDDLLPNLLYTGYNADLIIKTSENIFILFRSGRFRAYHAKEDLPKEVAQGTFTSVDEGKKIVLCNKI